MPHLWVSGFTKRIRSKVCCHCVLAAAVGTACTLVFVALTTPFCVASACDVICFVPVFADEVSLVSELACRPETVDFLAFYETLAFGQIKENKIMTDQRRFSSIKLS